MARTATARKPKKSTVDPCTALMKLCGGRVELPIDRKLVAAVVGDRVVKTLPEVGRAFGREASTIRQIWRQGGMPGTTGKWNLVDIACWRLERDAKEAGRQKSTVSPKNERLAEIDLRIAELSLAKREREELEAQGRSVDLLWVRSNISVLIVSMREHMLGIPRLLHTFIPQKQRGKVSAEIDRLVRLMLTQASETSTRLLHERATEHYRKALEKLDELKLDDDFGDE